MITIKGYSIIPKELRVNGDIYYGNHVSSPISEVYSSFEEAATALWQNKNCYFNPSEMVIKEVEILIK